VGGGAQKGEEGGDGGFMTSLEKFPAIFGVGAREGFVKKMQERKAKCGASYRARGTPLTRALHTALGFFLYGFKQSFGSTLTFVNLSWT